MFLVNYDVIFICSDTSLMHQMEYFVKKIYINSRGNVMQVCVNAAFFYLSKNALKWKLLLMASLSEKYFL